MSRAHQIWRLQKKLLTILALFIMSLPSLSRYCCTHMVIVLYSWTFLALEFTIAIPEKYICSLCVQDGIDAIEDVIYHIETYDVTTIRASTPMFLMSRKIKSLGVKWVISGEGSDEIFGGYLYFHKAPNKKEFHEETCRKVVYHTHTYLLCFSLKRKGWKNCFYFLILCRLRHFISMIAWELINQHLLGAWKLESLFWTRNLSMLQWALIPRIKWYVLDW